MARPFLEIMGSSRENLALKIKNDLGNIPDDVITMWLLPFAKKMGWPPTKEGYWQNLLCQKNLEFWQKSSWKNEIVDLSLIALSKNSLDAIAGFYDAYVNDAHNLYYQAMIGKTGNKKRFFDILKYMLENGKFPKPIILLKLGDGTYEVTDGCHRMTVLLHLQKIYEEFKIVDEKQKQEFLTANNILNFAAPLSTQESWIVS